MVRHPASKQDDADSADTLAGIIAGVGGDAVGITTIKQHSPYAAEIQLMAIKPAFHRHGIGRLMVRRVEQRLAADAC
jgi:GNAT superfamily N-acetyltransferase